MAFLVPHRIDQFEVDHSRILGKGTYGIVYLGRDLSTEDPVAIKLMTPSPTGKNEARSMTLHQRELDILQSSDNPNIVRILHHRHIEGSVYIILEFCQYNLQTFAASNELSQDLKAQFAEEIISAVHYLHHCSIIHRDIKPDNILIKLQGDVKKIKLTDFGMSKRIIGDAFTATGYAGTQLYMAPEVYADAKGDYGRYGKSADCFSLGLVLSQLELHREGGLPLPVTGPDKRPYGLYLKLLLANNEHIHEVFVDGDRSAIRQLISRLLRVEPQDRCTIEEALSVIQALRVTGQVFRFGEASRESHDVDNTAAGPQPHADPAPALFDVDPTPLSAQTNPPPPSSQSTLPQHAASLPFTGPSAIDDVAAGQFASADQLSLHTKHAVTKKRRAKDTIKNRMVSMFLRKKAVEMDVSLEVNVQFSKDYAQIRYPVLGGTLVRRESFPVVNKQPITVQRVQSYIMEPETW